MKKAFTFSELMVSLAIIAILGAVLYPMLLTVNPNTNKPLFKSAYRVLTSVLHNITTASADGRLPAPVSGATNTTGEELCEDFCTNSNVVPLVDNSTTPPNMITDCNSLCVSSNNISYLQTSNGMRWWFFNYPNVGDDNYFDPEADTIRYGARTFQVIVDVNSKNNDLPATPNRLDAGAGNILNNALQTSSYGTPNLNWANATGFTYYNSASVFTDSDRDGTPDTYDPDLVKAQDTFVFLIDQNGKILRISPAGWANLEDDDATN